MNRILFSLFLSFFLFSIPVDASSYIEDYYDLSVHQKTIANTMITKIKNYNGPSGYIIIKNVGVVKDFDELNHIINAMNQTFCPYTTKLPIDLMYGTNTEEGLLGSIRVDAVKAQKLLKTNQKDKKKMKKWLKKAIRKKMSKKNKAKAIAKFIAKKTKYKSFVLNDKFKYPDSILRKGKGNCRAMSMLYKEMCNSAGISCKYVSGFYKTEKHGWNMLKIGNKKFFTDVTKYRPHKNKKKFLVVKKLPKGYRR